VPSWILRCAGRRDDPRINFLESFNNGLFVARKVCQPPQREDRQVVGQLGADVQPVRHHHDRPVIVLQPFQQVSQHPGRVLVQAGERLIQEQQIGLVKERSGNGQALFHSARERSNRPVHGVAEAELLQQFLCPTVALVFVGIIGSSFFNYEKEFTIQEGQTQQIKHLTVQFDKFGQRKDVNKEVVYAALSIFQNGKRVALLQPEKHFHFKGEQPQTEVDIYSTYKEDLYVILAGWDQKQVTFKVYLNPIVTWIWYGVGIMVLGTLFLLTPDRRKISAKLQARREEVKHVA